MLAIPRPPRGRPNPPAALGAALAYAARGWAVLPLAPREKVPAGRLVPHGCRDASTDPERVERWWATEPEAGVGIATGAVSDLAVVDLDGEAGEESYGRLLSTHGPPSTDPRRPDGATVRTPGGGWHVYVRPPAGAVVNNTTGKPAPGIDVRGEGGYVVAPPSRHPEGGRYTWCDWPPAGLLPELTTAWVALLAPPRPEPAPTPRVSVELAGASGTTYGVAALRELLGEVAHAVEGTRHAVLYRAAARVAELAEAGHLAGAECRARLALAAAHTGLPEGEVVRAIADAWARVGGAL